MQQNKSLVDYFCEHLGKLRKVYEVESGRAITFDQLYANACSKGALFAQEEKKIITVVLPNAIEYIECLLAVLMTRNIFNPVPYFISLQELKKVLNYIEPTYIITDREDIIETFGQEYRVMRPADGAQKAGTVRKTTDEELPAALYYSSGTTGNPKGVLYSHKNMVSLIASIIRGFKFTENDHQLAFLPFGHTASINYNILPALMVGSDLYISNGFESLRNSFFEVLSKHQITYTEIVPTVLLMLLKLNVDVSKYDFSALHFIGCGSSTLPLVSQEAFIEKYRIKVANLYGLSESGPTHIDDPLALGWKPGSIGVPLDVNACRIDADGEILLKGDNIFIGYYKNECLYREVVQEGWFHTGDLGYEKDGKFYYVDRKKDLIIKGGINIVPMEVEEALYKHANVHECVVVGEQSELYGEEVVAVVVAKSPVDEQAFISELKICCKNELTNYKVPLHIYIWQELPKTHSNKLMRRTVRDIINAKAKKTQ